MSILITVLATILTIIIVFYILYKLLDIWYYEYIEAEKLCYKEFEKMIRELELTDNTTNSEIINLYKSYYSFLVDKIEGNVLVTLRSQPGEPIEDTIKLVEAREQYFKDEIARLILVLENHQDQSKFKNFNTEFNNKFNSLGLANSYSFKKFILRKVNHVSIIRG